MSAVIAGGQWVNLIGPDQAAKRPNPDKFGTASPISPERVARVQRAIAAGDTTLAAGYADLLAPPAYPVTIPAYSTTRVPNGPQSNPWQVPNGYIDPDGNQAQLQSLRYDAITAYNLALRYLFEGTPAHAETAAAQIDPWTALTGFINDSGEATRLQWACHFPLMLAAASMIQDSAAWTPTRETALQALTHLSIDGDDFPTPGTLAWTRTHNQGDMGVFLYVACTAYLGDRTRFDAGIARWKTIMDESVDQNLNLWQEAYRADNGYGDGHSGLHYQLMALNGKIRTAELARANGVWLYDYEAPTSSPRVVADPAGNTFTLTGGGSLKKLWDHLMPWLAAPLTYPYNTSGLFPRGVEFVGQNLGWMEVAQRLWPRSDAASVLAAARPIFDYYGGSYFSLTYPNLPLRG